ncbi:DUF397 domain-containing protein [Streptomyces cremeus]|uniref:DUF397 domain-containing protein n=1 Tax=Streptomyces cremeus TaxID=66881 RepID=A0ABV5PCU0_STRCM
MTEAVQALHWFKSSYSDNGGSCVEVATQWSKSSYSSNGGNCVEIATPPDAVLIRDSKNPDGPRLGLTTHTFAAFLTGIQSMRQTQGAAVAPG